MSQHDDDDELMRGLYGEQVYEYRREQAARAAEPLRSEAEDDPVPDDSPSEHAMSAAKAMSVAR